MRLVKGVVVAASAMVLAATAACSGTGQPAAPAANSGGSGSYGYKFSVITHGAPGDTFWDVVKKGAEKAGSDEGVTVNYQASGGDPAKQSQLIDAAVNEKADGIVVSMANPDALQASIKKATAAGIPVITINSGQDKSKAFGALAHVGQNESIAGQGAGTKLRDSGVHKLLCVIHEANNIGLQQRCAGAQQGIGGSEETLQVDINNMADAQNRIKGKLTADSTIDGVLTLNPAIGAVAVTAISDAHSQAKLATFDLNGDVVNAIKGGKMLFAVDQQQYEQGYLPIVMLKLYLENNNTVGGGQPVLTGPGFVTKENASTVEKLTKAGTR
jgi:simple sugar transport system substrate-binding protein